MTVRDGKKNGDTVNARRARTYLKLLRWSGLRAGDAACLSRDKLRNDDSLFLYRKRSRAKQVPPSMVCCPTTWPRNCATCRAMPTHIRAISFGVVAVSLRAKFRIGSKSLGRFSDKATEAHPKLFLEADGNSRPAHLHMLRDTFAVEYLLAGMPLEEVSRLLGHSSVLITQKHYAPWVLERQQRLATSVRTAWSTMGLNAAAPVINIADRRSGKVVRRAVRS